MAIQGICSNPFAHDNVHRQINRQTDRQIDIVIADNPDIPYNNFED